MIKYAYSNLYEKELQLRIVFWTGIAVAIFLNVFQPFGINNGGFNLKGILMVSGYGLITSLGLMIMIILGKPFRKLYEFHPIVFCTASLTFIASLIFAYFRFTFNNQGGTDGFIDILLNTLIVGVLMLLIFKGVFSNSHILKQSKLDGIIVIPSRNKSESGIQLIPSNLVMIESHGNYIMIYYLHGNGIKTKLIRNTMKEATNICGQYNGLVRCHASFIINTHHAIEKIKTKRDHSIVINYIDKSIPFSNKYFSSLKSLIE